MTTKISKILALVFLSIAAAASAAAIAETAVLYEEDPTDPQGKRYLGSISWRIEIISERDGRTASVVRAEVMIPSRKLQMNLLFKKNDNKQLLASHTFDIRFTLPRNFIHGKVQSVPGILLKNDERERGVPLKGLAVKTNENHFLIGLSNVGPEVQKNLQLLQEYNWFDLPIIATDGRRSILAFEKGTAGQSAFDVVLRSGADQQVATAVAPNGSRITGSRIEVPLKRVAGIFVVPVLINDAIALDFVVDSGAADVSIPSDVVMALIRKGTISDSDFIGSANYTLADGSIMPSKIFRIRSLKVGNRVIENVTASLAPMRGQLLLGQSFLTHFKSWSIDNTTHALILNE